jgi:hypothetical protein
MAGTLEDLEVAAALAEEIYRKNVELGSEWNSAARRICSGRAA